MQNEPGLGFPRADWCCTRRAHTGGHGRAELLHWRLPWRRLPLLARILARLARLDGLAECTSLKSLTLGAGLEYVSLLPDLSTRSDLEVRTADDTSQLVQAWAATKFMKKLKQGSGSSAALRE